MIYLALYYNFITLIMIYINIIFVLMILIISLNGFIINKYNNPNRKGVWQKEVMDINSLGKNLGKRHIVVIVMGVDDDIRMAEEAIRGADEVLGAGVRKAGAKRQQTSSGGGAGIGTNLSTRIYDMYEGSVGLGAKRREVRSGVEWSEVRRWAD